MTPTRPRPSPAGCCPAEGKSAFVAVLGLYVYQDRLAVPARGASFLALPAVPKRLEGLNPTLAILDEFRVIFRDV